VGPTIYSLPFIMASIATAFLPHSVNMGFDWLTE